ncbi:MAG: sugar transferase [Deltaproteobacteria bacterium]|nr:sugar transferase [Deltaproteobacteria bacterium]
MNQDRNLLKRIELLVDVLLTLLAFIFAYAIKKYLTNDPFGGLASEYNYLFIMMMVVVIWYVTLDFLNDKHNYGAKISGSMLVGVFKGVTISAIILVLCLYILKIKDISRLLIFMFYFLDLVALYLCRWMIRKYVSIKRNKDFYNRYVLVIGSRVTARELIQMVANSPETDIKFVGCLDLNRKDIRKTVCCGVQIIGTLDDLRGILLSQVIDEVLITMPLNTIDKSEWYLSFINTFGITIRIIPQWYIRKFISTQPNAHAFQIDRFLSEPALILSTVQERQDLLVIKSILDFFLAIFVLIISFPLFVLISGLIKLSSPGPVFYKQIRCSQFGRKFAVYKFRTMVQDAEEKLEDLAQFNEACGPAFKMKNDPRIIPYIGTFLRKMSLDELPQFINVIRGEMSVVGPRPPIPWEVEKYELWQRRRLSMKPGITCTWQIQPSRNDISFDRWMNMDLDYIDRWSLWLDISLILKTLPAVFLGRGR